MKAGFATTVINPDKWSKFVTDMGILGQDWPLRTDKSWLWSFNGAVIVTSHNPYNGYHFNPALVNPSELGMLGYVGIEGDHDFVVEVFDYIVENADYVKDECLGNRIYI